MENWSELEIALVSFGIGIPFLLFIAIVPDLVIEKISKDLRGTSFGNTLSIIGILLASLFFLFGCCGFLICLFGDTSYSVYHFFIVGFLNLLPEMNIKMIPRGILIGIHIVIITLCTMEIDSGLKYLRGD